ncbi:glycosyltransferase [Planctomycetota bacterium]|nr:glycosyltransferase [Planctomycetota bacterium]
MKLLVITEELPSELATKGHSVDSRGGYYNPRGLFNDVALIDWASGKGWPGLPHRVLAMPADAGFLSWLQSVQMIDRNSVATESQLYTGFRGVPLGWLNVIRDFAPDVIRCYGTRWSAVLAVEVARHLGAKLLCSVHNTSEVSSSVLNQADGVMAVSEAVELKLVSECGVAPEKIQVVPNRVDTSVFAPKPIRADASKGLPRILSVARDVEQKNLDRLLQACEELLADYPELRLIHIGASGRDWTQYSFVEHIDTVPNAELPEWFSWADVFACPSLWEGFGIAIIEALACACPVLTSNRAPMSSLVDDGQTGATIDPEDVSAIAEGLRKLVGQKYLMAEACKQSIEKYTVENVESQEAALCQKIVDSVSQPVSSVKYKSDYSQLVYLAGAQKNNGLVCRSLLTSVKLIAKAPWRVAGYKAMVRALTPAIMLRAKRGMPRVRGSIAYSVMGKKISRDQWDENETSYDDYLTLPWEELKAHSPDYATRVEDSIKHCTGNVLEIGCGAGNMTRWIAIQKAVTGVLGVDGFEAAITKLNALGLPNVKGVVQDITQLDLPADYRFDTLVMCEFLEHIYPDEEAKLIAGLCKYAAENARYVISVPIGWLEDPHHVREFSKAKFKRHLSKHYGLPDSFSYNSGYSQVVTGILKP